MTAQDVLQELAVLGTEQNRKIYRRHGAGDNTYGVSYANLNALKKKLKRNTPLAEQLWASAIHDARILATMIADSKNLSEQTIDAWANDLPNYIVADALAGLVAQTPFARARMEQWYTAEHEPLARAGWSLLGQLAMKDKDLPDSFFAPYLELIARDIHTSKNRIKEAMNSALIAIGTRNETLEHQAIAIARQIGPVEVDHGETDCATPLAEPYIRKARARKSPQPAASGQ
jgi:3-methyladenine DNA glycosylase AlkD